ncbi:MAG: hypothetical protein ACI35W_03975 [Anaeroplasmataceae bacterium]
MNKGEKYDVPVLMDPRLQKMEYCKPMDLVLCLTKDGKLYLVRDLIEQNTNLKNEINKLSKAIVDVNSSLTSLKKEHNKLVRGYKKQITALKVQIATLGGKK